MNALPGPCNDGVCCDCDCHKKAAEARARRREEDDILGFDRSKRDIFVITSSLLAAADKLIVAANAINEIVITIKDKEVMSELERFTAE